MYFNFAFPLPLCMEKQKGFTAICALKDQSSCLYKENLVQYIKSGFRKIIISLCKSQHSTSLMYNNSIIK